MPVVSGLERGERKDCQEAHLGLSSCQWKWTENMYTFLRWKWRAWPCLPLSLFSLLVCWNPWQPISQKVAETHCIPEWPNEGGQCFTLNISSGYYGRGNKLQFPLKHWIIVESFGWSSLTFTIWSIYWILNFNDIVF